MSLRRAALYVGGFMGPFAGGMTVSILPELGASFGVSTDTAATSIVFYLVPFASLMLVSGRLGEFFGPKRAITTAYFVFFAAALLCMLAPNWPLFVMGCVLSGVANAFTTPILLATLGVTVARAKLGAALGLYAAMQGMGQLSSPLFSGLAAHIDWRIAYGAVAVVALVLGLISIPSMPRTRASLQLRSMFAISRPVWGYATVYFAIGACLAGLGFLVALHAADAFGASSSERGLIVMTGGIASLAVSALSGIIVDRVGERKVMLFGLVLGGLMVAALPFAPTMLLLALVWGAAMCFGQSIQISVNKLVLNLKDASGAISVVQAFRFFGSAAAPLVILPIYAHHTGLSFWMPGAILVIVGLCVLWGSASRGRQSQL